MTTKLWDRSADEVCGHFQLSAAGKDLPRAECSARAFLEQLRERELYRDATFVLAQVLPKREAVWWGCLCVWELMRPKPNPDEDKALDGALAWLREPTEEHRVAAGTAAERVDSTAAGMVANAAFYSSGSMSRPGLPVVPPPEHLTHTMVAGAVLTATAAAPLDEYRQRCRHALQWGIDVADRLNLWPQASAS